MGRRFHDVTWSRTDHSRRLQARCPVCSRGPLSERDIADLQRADGKKPKPKPNAKKSGYSVDKVASSPGSSSSKEVLTLLSSDDEDAPPSPKKDVKGKGKAKVTEITLDSSSDEDGGGDDSEDYMPSSPPHTTNLNDDDDDDETGKLDSSDDEDGQDSPNRHMLLSKSDFRASTKLDALVKSLQKAKEKDSKLKAVVFSQVR